MTQETTKASKPWLSNRMAIVLAIVASCLYLAVVKFAYSPNGTLQMLEIAQAVGGLLALISLVGVMSVVPFMLLPSLKGKSPLDPRIPAVFFIGSVLSLINGQQLRMQEFAALSKRSQPLTAAIHRYVKATGHEPGSLKDLVPQYLPAVPSTGMGAYPSYEYDVVDTTSGKQWELKVPCSVGFLHWGLFFYRSTEKYEAHEHGGTVQRMGNWAYVHD